MTEFLNDLPMREYHKLDRLSSSQIKNLLRSRKYWEAQLARPNKATPDMVIGTAIHSLLLTPDQLSQEVAIAPADGCSTRTTKAYKEWAAEQSPDKALLLNKEWQQAKAAADHVRQHPHWGQYLDNLEGAEGTVLWDEDEAIHCKARIDGWFKVDGKYYLLDVKTCQNATTTHSGEGRPFHYIAWDYGYHVQLAWYRRGWQKCVGEVAGCLILAVEKHAPHTVRLFDMDQWLEYGDKLIDQALANYNDDPEITSVTTLPLPGWAKYQETA